MSEPDDIRNWLRLSDRITTSGKLDSADPRRLADIGVKRVINLALADHPEALPDADAAMAAAGLGYTHIPVPFDAPSKEHYSAFVAALEEDDMPVHVHCIMNWRVSAFFCRYHREKGMDDAEARALMHRVWDPVTMDYANADKWAAFVAGEE